MRKILNNIRPVIEQIAHIEDEAQAADIVAEMREKGLLSENECYALAFIWLAGQEHQQRQKARASTQKPFIASF